MLQHVAHYRAREPGAAKFVGRIRGKLHCLDPKLSLILVPWNKTEYFVNLGGGFHSNDARGMTARISPKEGTPIDSTAALVRTNGSELGLRTEAIAGLQSSLALWQLHIGSELVFSGGAGDTGASGASRRYGFEFNNHYRATPWLLLDADIAVSRAEFTTVQGNVPNAGRYVPGWVETVVSGVADRHFHPVVPRSLRVTLTSHF